MKTAMHQPNCNAKFHSALAQCLCGGIRLVHSATIGAIQRLLQEHAAGINIKAALFTVLPHNHCAYAGAEHATNLTAVQLLLPKARLQQQHLETVQKSSNIADMKQTWHWSWACKSLYAVCVLG